MHLGVLAAVGRQSGIIEELAYQMTTGLIAVTLLPSPIAVLLARGSGGRVERVLDA